MKREGRIKSLALPLLSLLFLSQSFGIASASPQRRAKAKKPAAAANQSPAAPQASGLDSSSQSPDIEIKAKVTAKELKFEVVGNATVEFKGSVGRETVSNFDRGNLPDPVKPGVVYRDIEIRLLVTSMFADIKRIVSEILHEESVNQDKSRQKNEPAQTRTLPPVTKKPGGGTQR